MYRGRLMNRRPVKISCTIARTWGNVSRGPSRGADLFLLTRVAVTAALWTGVRAWLLGAELYLPEAWLTPERRQQARIPSRVRFQENWRLALTLIRRALAAGLQLDLVVADAGYGDAQPFRTAVERLHLLYVVGVSSTLTMWLGVPHVVAPPPQPLGGRPRTRAVVAADTAPISAATWAAQQPLRAWRCVRWRNGQNRPWAALFVAIRVTPVVLWRRRQRLHDVWLLCQRPLGATTASKHDKYFLSNLPATTTLRALVRAAHQRWAIEQQYQDLTTELGFDHFEGRSYPGWQHHAVITAVAYAFLQKERIRPRDGPRLTFPQVRAIVQELAIPKDTEAVRPMACCGGHVAGRRVRPLTTGVRPRVVP